MPKLTLENGSDFLDLDDILNKGKGVQATAGVTGLGLPPVAVQWLEGAGDGARYRGTRYLSRDIDLPLLIDGGSREGLKELTRKLSLMLRSECVLRFVEDDGTDWHTTVVRTGGGSYSYGIDTRGDRDFRFVITVRAGDPFWTASKTLRKEIGVETVRRGMLPKLGALKLTSSQTIGQIDLDNTESDADTYPVWRVTGPGRNFIAISPKGERLAWLGTLAVGESITLDTKNGTVVDQKGVNRYDVLDTAPRFWAIPPGFSTGSAMLENTVSGQSLITCTWQPRRHMVI